MMADRVTCLACHGERYSMDGVSRCLHCDENGLIGPEYAEELQRRGFGEQYREISNNGAKQ